MNNGEKSVFYINLLSIVSALSVVTLHTNGVFWIFSTSRYWFTANIIESFFYFAVPIFFMIPGATLLNFYDRYDLGTYFKKRICKTFIPFLLWSIIGLFYRLFVLKDINIDHFDFSFFWNGIWETKFVSIYWFFIPLFCVYLAIPLFASIPKEKRLKLFKYLTVTAFILNILLPFFKSVFHVSWAFPFRLDVASGYLFYVLAGYIFSHVKIEKKYRIAIYILAIAGLMAHIIGTYCLSIQAGEIIKTFKGYNNVPCVLYSLGVFLFLQNLADYIPAKLTNVINAVKSYTFPIYLLHWFIMTFMVKLFHLNTFSIVYRLGGASNNMSFSNSNYIVHPESPWR